MLHRRGDVVQSQLAPNLKYFILKSLFALINFANLISKINLAPPPSPYEFIL